MKNANFKAGLVAAFDRLRRRDDGDLAPTNAPSAAVIRPQRFNAPVEVVAHTPKVATPKPLRKPKFSFAQVTAVLMIGVPSVLGALYYGLLASDQYSTGIQLAVRSNDKPAAENMAAAIPGLGSSPVTSDSYILVEYLRSRQLVEDVSKNVDLRAMFRRPSIDMISRLDSNAPAEELVEYWRKKIDVRFESQSGIISASVRAFQPEDSLAISRAALKLCERLVNDLSRKAREESLSTAEEDVKRMEMRLAASIAMMKKFRDRTGVIDPQKGAGAGVQVIGKLQEELVRLRTQLSILSKNMSPSAPPIMNLKARITATEEQITIARDDVGRSASESKTPELTSQLLSEYESLDLERQFSEKAYTATLTSLEHARSEASRTQRYLSVFVEPHLPQEASHPRRLMMIFSVLAFSFLAWAIFSLIYLTVKEHMT